jgi:hypothetical protein
MFIEKIDIKKFRVLSDITVDFQAPNSATADTGNIVNILAISNPHSLVSGTDSPNNSDRLLGTVFLSDFGKIGKNNWLILHKKIESLNKQNAGSYNFYDSPRIIFLPSQQNFQYSAVSQLAIKYSFSQRINTHQIIGQAEFYIKEFVLNKERESTLANPSERTKAAIDAFNKNFLDAKLLTKLVDLSKKMFNCPVFENASGEAIREQLAQESEHSEFMQKMQFLIELRDA